MAKDKDKHPSWFKMKLERRELVRQLSPETAVNVLLACWDFLETGEKPANLSPIESVAFSAFMPDMEEAWARYVQRITARHGPNPVRNNHTVPYGTIWGAYGTEVEEETEVEVRSRLYKGIRERSRFRAPLHPPRQRRQILAV